MAKKLAKLFLFGIIAGVLGGGTFLYWMKGAIEPMPEGETIMLRYEESLPIADAFADMEKRGVIRNAQAAAIYARVARLHRETTSGTFEVRPGMKVREVVQALRSPMQQMVRLPEGWWIARTAKKLEEANVCSAEDYIKLANDPAQFQEYVDFPLPETSLEGYLYPDTYDLPPLLGAKQVILRQLRAFQDKVEVPEADYDKLHKAVIKASIIELEAAVDEERPKIAGVIENRIRDNWTLDMDASVLYALQEWRQLGPGEVRKVESPYNTYLNKGLPPGPIGSPTAKSIVAALNPQSHNLYFYVARPNRTHYFSTTYAEHRQNINKARGEWADQ